MHLHNPGQFSPLGPTLFYPSLHLIFALGGFRHISNAVCSQIEFRNPNTFLSSATYIILLWYDHPSNCARQNARSNFSHPFPHLCSYPLCNQPYTCCLFNNSLVSFLIFHLYHCNSTSVPGPWLLQYISDCSLLSSLALFQYYIHPAATVISLFYLFWGDVCFVWSWQQLMHISLFSYPN